MKHDAIKIKTMLSRIVGQIIDIIKIIDGVGENVVPASIKSAQGFPKVDVETLKDELDTTKIF